MAIQVGGTEVISNSQGLKNIASVDSTTADAINAVVSASPAGVADGLGGNFFVVSEDASDLTVRSLLQLVVQVSIAVLLSAQAAAVGR